MSFKWIHTPEEQKEILLWAWRQMPTSRRIIMVSLLISTALIGWSFLFVWQSSLQAASRFPTETQSVYIEDHAQRFYITPKRKTLCDRLGLAMWIVAPIAMGYTFYAIRFLAWFSDERRQTV